SVFMRLQHGRGDSVSIMTGNDAPSPRLSRTKKFLAFILRYLVSIAIGISSLFLAYKSLYVNAGSPNVVPAVALVTWPQPANPTLRPGVSVDMSAGPGYLGCGMFHVHVVFTPLSGFFGGPPWAKYTRGGPSPTTHFAIAVADVIPPQNIKVHLGGGDYYTFTR